jgi:hypothetical protein
LAVSRSTNHLYCAARSLSLAAIYNNSTAVFKCSCTADDFDDSTFA